MAAPTPQQLADQVVSLGNQLATLQALVNQQQAAIDVLKANKKDTAWNGLLDRKFMLPEKFEKK